MLSQASTQALARLRSYTPPPTNYNKLPLTRRAAVLILLLPDRYGDLKVVLTMRAATLRNYAGQVALPGGKADTLEESPFATARREAYEEIGLPTTDAQLPAGFRVEHLCELPLNLAKTELGVRPCVAVLWPSSQSTSTSSSSSSSSSSASSTSEVTTSSQADTAATDPEAKLIPRLDPKEVAAVFTAPFAQFLRATWTRPEPGPVGAKGAPHSWYRGSWTDWHEARWRMHNFYMPKPRASRGPPGAGAGSSTTTPMKTSPMHTAGPGKRSITGPAQAQAQVHTQPEGDDPRPEPAAFEDLPHFRVFGMTARILVDAARLAYGAEPEFEHNSHFGDEDMIGGLLGMGRMGEVRRTGEELTPEVLRRARSRM